MGDGGAVGPRHYLNPLGREFHYPRGRASGHGRPGEYNVDQQRNSHSTSK